MPEIINNSDNSQANILLYGQPGTWKSSLAAQGPLPQLVYLFDSINNGKPYFNNCRVVRSRDWVMLGATPSEIPMYDCYALEDKERKTLLRKVLHFASPDPNNPIGAQQFRPKLPTIAKDCKELNIKSYVFDSLTLFTAQARHAVGLYRDVAPDQIAREVTDYYEDLCMVLASLPVTTIAISHLTTRGEIKQVGVAREMKNIRIRVDDVTTAPGRMADRVFGYFSDVWCCFLDANGKGLVRTSGNDATICKNTFNAPPICNNNYQEITANRQPIIWEEE